MFQDCLEGTVLLIKLDVIAVSGGMLLLLAPAGKSDSISKMSAFNVRSIYTYLLILQPSRFLNAMLLLDMDCYHTL